MTLLQSFVFLTPSAEMDIDQLADKAILKFWDVMPGFTLHLMQFAVILLPAVMLVLGLIGLCFPPKEPNWIIGYSTRRALASEESWFFAQKLRGILWTVAGTAMLIPSLILRNLMKDATMDYICRMVITYVIVQVAVLVLSLLVIRVVMLLRFDRNGNRKR